jgi:hypothetical protein
MNKPETQSRGSLEPVGSVSLEELEAKLERQARAGDVDGFHATLREIDTLSAQDRTLLAMLAVCLIGTPPNQPHSAGHDLAGAQ